MGGSDTFRHRCAKSVRGYTSALLDAPARATNVMAKGEREKIAVSDRDDRLTSLPMSEDVAIEPARCFSGRTSPHGTRTCDCRLRAEGEDVLARRQPGPCETIRERSQPIRSMLTASMGSADSPSVVRHNRLLQKLNLSRSHRPFGHLMANSTATY